MPLRISHLLSTMAAVRSRSPSMISADIERAVSTTSTRARSPSTPPNDVNVNEDERATKRRRISNSHTLPYNVGLHLAPMVRIGTLPTRLLALEYGASLVWGPEIVDRAIIGSTRTVDERTGTIKFMKKDKSIFECHPIEKERLIFQLGSADPDLAVQAVKLIENDVAGIGLNCGCPKQFSISGGMGAALLKTPDKLCAILRALVSNCDVPIDAKIRLLPEQEPTIKLVSQIVDTGISNLTVHCRTQDMRPREPALLHRLRIIVESVNGKVPVVANGDCVSYADQEKIKELTGVESIMIARGAEANVSCFRPEGNLDPVSEVIPRFLKVAMAVDNAWQNTKYILNSMNLAGSSMRQSERAELKQKLNKAKSYDDIFEVFGMQKLGLNEKYVLEDLVPNWIARRKEIIGMSREESDKQTAC